MNLKGRRLLWEDIKQTNGPQQLTFDGIPFIIMGETVLDCQHGVDRNLKLKLKNKTQVLNEQACRVEVYILCCRFQPY